MYLGLFITAADESFTSNVSSSHRGGTLYMIVEGAGAAEVNGVYEYCGVHNEGMSFVRTVAPDDEPTVYYIYRGKIRKDKKRFQWLICSPPGNSPPGTSGRDRVYYSAPSWRVETEADCLPPTQMAVWSVADASHGRLPCPSLCECSDEDLYSYISVADGEHNTSYQQDLNSTVNDDEDKTQPNMDNVDSEEPMGEK